MKTGRREFLVRAGLALPGLYFLKSAAFTSCAGDGKRAHIFLSDEEFRTVEALTSTIIPSGETNGALEAGAAEYIDRLLGAFSFDPPLIFAGGPFSGRKGGGSSFNKFVRLSRIEEIGWRAIIEGSNGVPEREFNGPVKGWQTTYRKSLQNAGKIAQKTFGAALPDLDAMQRAGVVKLLTESDPDFMTILTAHTVEGTYGAPEYGGNSGLSGWKAIGYPGDAQPIGYSEREMREADPDALARLLSNDLLGQFVLEFVKRGELSGMTAGRRRT